MFDDLEIKSPNNEAGRGQTKFEAKPAAREQKKFPPAATEDIFAEVDSQAAPAAEKPAQLRPISAKPPRVDDFYPEMKDRRHFVLLAMIGTLVVLIAIVIYINISFFRSFSDEAPLIAENSSDQSKTVDKPAAVKEPETTASTQPEAEPAAGLETEGLPAETATSTVAQPTGNDLDRDGLADEDEAVMGTNPLLADTDADGLTDYDEAIIYKSDPLKADTDGDGYSDGDEVKTGYNPLGSGRLFGNGKDTEQLPLAADSDNDGLSDSDEAEYYTDKDLADTDADGLSDYQEVKMYFTNPLKADTDGDGYADGAEVKNGFNPNGSGRIMN